jgi:hypothetical protein
VSQYRQQLQAEKESLHRLLKAVQDEIAALLKERHSIDQRILSLQGDFAHLTALCGQPAQSPLTELGLTDAIRFVIATAKIPLTFTDIRDALKQGSFDVAQYTNLMASIHTVITRLVKYGEVKKVTGIPTGEILFAWAEGSLPAQILNKPKWVGRLK